MKRVTYLLLTAALVALVGIGLWYIGRSDSANSAALETAGEVVLWIGLLGFALGVLLLAVFALTRFVVWAAHR